MTLLSISVYHFKGTLWAYNVDYDIVVQKESL